MKSSTAAADGCANLFPGLTLEALEQLFAHVPDTVFFVKDREGRYRAANKALADRCNLPSTSHLMGKRVHDLFPIELADRYAAQDASVLLGGPPVMDRLELHWHTRGRAGWCLTTKFALKDSRGDVTGLIGISRDIQPASAREDIPPSLVRVLDHLETACGDPMSPTSLARMAGLAPSRFARLIKRIFRITPSQLIAQTRLDRAAHLLRQSSLGIAEIALECGFCDHSAFTRAFRSATALTPTQYRDRIGRQGVTPTGRGG